MNRKTLPDLLKGIAVILMVQVHLMELFARQDIFDGAWGRLSLFLGGPPAAPIFMAVMGYFLAGSNSSFSKHIYRGVKLIVWGFLLNIGLNLHLFFSIFSEKVQVNPLHYLFGVDILFLAGISVIVIAILKKAGRDKIWVYLSALLLVMILSFFVPRERPDITGFSYLQAYFFGTFEWSYFPLIPWFVYPLAGFIVRRVEPNLPDARESQAAILIFGLFCFLVTGMTWARMAEIPHQLPLYYHHGPAFMLWTAGFLCLWVILFWFVDRKLGNTMLCRYTRWVGKNVTNFYVFQWLIIGNLGTKLYKTQGGISLLFYFSGIMLVTSLLVMGWQRFKHRHDVDVF